MTAPNLISQAGEPRVLDSRIRKNAERQRWILQFLADNTEASCLTQKFHDEYHARFGGARKAYVWGACPVAGAMRMLRELAKQGILEVRHISMGFNWQPGFPKWCRSYSLVPHAPPAMPQVETRTAEER